MGLLSNTAPILNMSVISDVLVNCNGLHSAEISQAWQFKSIYCFTDRSPPFNPPKLLDPCAIYCAGRPLVRFSNSHECPEASGLGNLTRRPHTTNKILTWKRSVDLELNWPTCVWSSIHSDIQEKWVDRLQWQSHPESCLEYIGRHWKTLSVHITQLSVMASVMWSVMGLDMGLEYHRESDVAGIAQLWQSVTTHSLTHWQ